MQLNNKVFGKVEAGEKVESPGMKHRHYAPNTKCVLVYDEDEALQIEKINNIISKNEKVCVLGFDEHKSRINIDKFISLGSISKLEEISKNIYRNLRYADKENAGLIIIEGIKKEGFGIAIMNRLIRACEYEVG